MSGRKRGFRLTRLGFGQAGGAEEAEAVEFGDGSVEAVFEASFVHEESVEDAGVGEIVDDDAADGGVAAGSGGGLFAGAVEAALFTAEHFLEGVGGLVGVEVVEGFVLEALGAEESPGEGDGAVGEHGFDAPGGIQFGEHLVAVGFELAGVLAGDDGLGGA